LARSRCERDSLEGGVAVAEDVVLVAVVVGSKWPVDMVELPAAVTDKTTAVVSGLQDQVSFCRYLYTEHTVHHPG
jgi:hypothetical protein